MKKIILIFVLYLKIYPLTQTEMDEIQYNLFSQHKKFPGIVSYEIDTRNSENYNLKVANYVAKWCARYGYVEVYFVDLDVYRMKIVSVNKRLLIEKGFIYDVESDSLFSLD